MFCKKCGSQLPEGVAFCTACGSKIEEEPVREAVFQSAPMTEETVPAEPVAFEEATPAEAPVATEPVAEQPVPTGDGFVQVQFDEPVKKVKKGKNLLAIAMAVVALVAVGAVLIVMNFGALQGAFIKTFGSDADYFKYVEKNAFNSYTDSIVDVYGRYTDSVDDVSAKTKFKINVGDDVVSLLENYLKSSGVSYDLDWLNEISFDMNTNVQDSVRQILLALNVGDKAVLNADAIFDLPNNELLLGLPLLSEQYLKLETDVGSNDGAAAMQMIYSSEFMEALPSDAELDALLDKYLEIAIECLDDVTVDSDTLEVDGVTQDVTVLELEIDKDTVMEILQQVLETAKDDADIKRYIEDFAAYMEEADVVDDAGEAYDEYQDMLDDALDDLKDADYENETLLTLIDYVDGDHEIVGRVLKVGDTEVLSYKTATDGDTFATLAELGTVKITGSGDEKGGKTNATYTLEVSGLKAATIVVSDFDSALAEDGYLNGTVTIEPSSDLLKSFGLNSSQAAALSLANPKLELRFAGDEDYSEVSINILNGESVLVGFTVTSEMADSADIQRPSDDNIVDQDDAQDWAESLDVDAIIDALKETSIPDDLVELLEQLMSGSAGNAFGSGGMSSGYNDYYDYNYDYDYDYDYGSSYDDLYGYGSYYS